MEPPLSWLIICICLIGSFFFSACETALGSCNRFKISVAADNGKRSAKVLLKVCDRYDRAISAILIGNNIVAVVISSVSAILFYDFFVSSFGSDSTYLEYAPLVSSIIMAFIVYLLGDTLPKTIARLIPDTISLLFVYPLCFFLYLLTPFSILFEALGKLIDKIFKVKDDTQFTEEDFENVIEKVADEGMIDEDQTEIIQSALEFADTNVKEVLTPKEKIFAIDITGLTHEKLANILANVSYSRIPVYKDNFQHFVGILNIKSYLISYMDNPNISIRECLQKPYYVSSRIMIDDLFAGFKKNHTHLALVRNNKKEVIGMVTMEDVLEEIVSGISEPNPQKVKKS